MVLTTGYGSVAVPAKRVTLTNPDSGRSVEASVGDSIEVRLTGYRDGVRVYTWDVPQPSDSAVLRRTAGGTTPSGGASAVFHVQRSGVARINVVRKCHPDPGHICPLIIVPWKATIGVK
ncbi:hypothetical protein AF335_20865 [Streptomyces eurocidicus]|nr:hypothetical protein AF335_20865 [Streptomyces eurocidicus]